MTGNIALHIALVCHLNAYKQGYAEPFFPANSSCTFCEYIRFLSKQRSLFRPFGQWRVIASTPDEWIATVTKANFYHAFLVYSSTKEPVLSDRMSAGFVGGGGDWTLCLEYEQGVDCWKGSWDTGDRNAPDRRIWRVDYHQVAKEISLTPDATSVADAIDAMHSALVEINDFAQQQDLSNFASFFQKALDCLKGTSIYSELPCLYCQKPA